MGKRNVVLSAIIVLVAVSTIMLAGCRLLQDDDSSTPAEDSVAAAYGLPRLPAVQGIIDFSASRAAEVLSNFEYREKDGVGQWTNNATMFDVLDNGTQATLETRIAGDRAGWVMQLSYHDGADWRDCTLESIQAGKDPDRATIMVFPERGVTIQSLQEAADFLDAMYSTARGVVALDSTVPGGFIVDAVLKNTTGAVCHVTEDAPGSFTLTVHPKSQWADGNYDELVDVCENLAAEKSCSCGEFLKSVPLFEDPRLEFVE